jgi:hypothetical protein
MELVRSSISIDGGLPCEKVRSAPAIVFSGPAQRSLMLRPARSPSRYLKETGAQADAFQAANPQATVIRIAHANHRVFQSNQPNVLRAMQTFIASLP